MKKLNQLLLIIVIVFSVSSCQDELLNKPNTESQINQEYPIEKSAATNFTKWPGGIIYYVFDSSIDNPLRIKILASMTDWQNKSMSAISFVPRTNQSNYITLKHNHDKFGSESGGLGLGTYDVILRERAYEERVIKHELGHAIGLHHEQCKPNRDLYVNIDPSLINDGNFSIMYTRIYYSPGFDFSSIMLYDYNGTITKKDGSSYPTISEINTLDGQSVYDLYNTIPNAAFDWTPVYSPSKNINWSSSSFKVSINWNPSLNTLKYLIYAHCFSTNSHICIGETTLPHYFILPLNNTSDIEYYSIVPVSNYGVTAKPGSRYNNYIHLRRISSTQFVQYEI